QSGAERWSVPLTTTIAPAVDRGRVFVAAAAAIEALDATTGKRLWTASLDSAVRAPMLVAGGLLLALTEPDRLTALDLETRNVVWTASVGAGPVMMQADRRAVYLTAPDSRVLSVRL